MLHPEGQFANGSCRHQDDANHDERDRVSRGHLNFSVDPSPPLACCVKKSGLWWRVDMADVLRLAPLRSAGRPTKRVAASLVVIRAAATIRPRARGPMLAGPMPLPDVQFWATLAIVALCALNAAMAIFEVVLGRPSWLRRLLNFRGRVPATPRDWRLHGAVMSLASGGVMLLTIGQGLTVGSLFPWDRSLGRVLLALTMGLLGLLMLGAAIVVYLRVDYRPRPGAGQRG